MKKTILILILSTIGLSHLFAQKEAAIFPIQLPRVSVINTAKDIDGSVVYVFQNSKSLQLTIIDSLYNQSNQWIIPMPEAGKRDKLVGVMMNKQNVTLFFMSDNTLNFTSAVVSRRSGQPVFNTIGVRQKNDMVLKAFVIEEKFYVLAVQNHTNLLKTLISASGSVFSEVVYTVEMPDFFRRLSEDNNLLNEEPLSPIGIERISYDVENSIKSTYPKKKMYTVGDKIYFTFDDPGITHLVVVDPELKTAVYRKMTFTLERDDKSGRKQGNSFIIDNVIYRATISPQQLTLSIIDLQTMQLLNLYNIYPDEAISIANGPILEENTTTGAKIMIDKTGQYFSKVINGQIGVSVNKSDSLTQVIELGSYNQSTNYTGGMSGGNYLSWGVSFGMGGYGAPGLGLGYGSPYSGMGFPGYWGNGYPYSNGNYTLNVEIVYFKTLLDDYTYAPLKNPIPTPIRDKIKEYNDNMFRKVLPEGLKVIAADDRRVLLSYVTRNNNYQVIEFLRSF